MIKSALEFLMNAGKTEVLEVDGQKYSTHGLTHVKSLLPAPIEMSTLTGFVDYLKTDADNFGDKSELIIHVVSEDTVKLLSQYNTDFSRNCYVICKAKIPKLLLDTYIDTEKFNVMLQSCFLDLCHRADVLKIISNIKEDNVKNTSDDGISQKVVARVGVATDAYVNVPNPVTLVPFRTFIEVEQPESKFVLRLKDGPVAGLFEADGGEWRLSSMLRIKKYLQDALPDMKILA